MSDLILPNRIIFIGFINLIIINIKRIMGHNKIKKINFIKYFNKVKNFFINSFGDLFICKN